jgi:hypothetical protein
MSLPTALLLAALVIAGTLVVCVVVWEWDRRRVKVESPHEPARTLPELQRRRRML